MTLLSPVPPSDRWIYFKLIYLLTNYEEQTVALADAGSGSNFIDEQLSVGFDLG